MHVPGEAAPGTGHAVAIVGAALRFPGACDPSSFFELTVAGRRMFRDLTVQAGGGPLSDGAETAGGAASSGRRRDRRRDPRRAVSPPARAALLDDESGARAHDELPRGVTARHALAAETAADALADV